MLVSLEAFSCFSRAPSMSSTVFLVSTINKRDRHSGQRPLRSTPKANTGLGLLKYYNGNIRKHCVWQVEGLQGPLVLHPPLVRLLSRWIALITFAADVCFTGHGGAPLNGTNLPVWRVWRTLNDACKKKERKKKGKKYLGCDIDMIWYKRSLNAWQSWWNGLDG